MVLFILSVFIAFALGLILFFSLQEKIPPELDFLKGGKSVAARVSRPGVTSSYKNWDVFKKPGSQVVTLENPTTFSISGRKETPFMISFTCSDGRLETGLTYGPGLNFVKPDRTDTAIIFLNKTKTTWVADLATTDKFKALDPKVVLTVLRKSPSVTAEFLEPGMTDPNTAVINPDGLEELAVQLPDSCTK